jgi:uncharacterized membrane protein
MTQLEGTAVADAGVSTPSPGEPVPSGGVDVDHARPPGVFEPRFSGVGLVFAGLFFAASLLPSLLPRDAAVQGLLSGMTLALGYGIGATVGAVWRWLGVPSPHGRARTMILRVLLGLAGLAIAASIWQYVGWQDAQRAHLGMPPIVVSDWFMLAGVALLVAAILVVVGRLVRALSRFVIHLFDRFLPRRLAIALGCTAVALLLAGVYTGVLVRGFWAATNAVFAPRNNIEKPGVTGPPASPERSGGPGSLVSWESLGREGRAFVSLGPTREQLQATSPDVPAKEPIRVFAGLRSADSVQQRADLVLAELIRTGAFDREVLVLATSTGSGFVDPGAIDPLEHLWHGNTAVASVQYSYLPSWLSLLADSENVQEEAQTLFRTVYQHLRTLPEDQRPQVYLYGLSLGSYGVQSVLTNIEMLNDPVDGALMTGPPFVNPLHQRLTADRDPGSPIWQPVYQDGRTVRFTANPPTLTDLPGPWGPTRVAYLQHDTDPVVWFSPTLAWRQPEWLAPGERGPNLSPEFVWRPLVTVWQVLFDLTSAGTVPWGHGHLYKPSENTHAWAAVSRPLGWTPAEVDGLATQMDQQILGG